ncbi:MAG TPA: deoxyribodipyrimidine photo-lyase [Solirubrobacteraceae bacterium]
MTALVWFRRDLRIHDHPALRAALDRSDEVIPVFCLDDRLINGRHRSGPRTQFMLESLADLDDSLRAHGTRLVVRRGNPQRELVALARQTSADTVHASVDASPFARSRDRSVGQALAEAGVHLRGHPGVFVADDVDAIRTGGGDPYTVFTPFHKTWLRAGRREVLHAPSALPPLPTEADPGRLPSLSELGLQQEVGSPSPGGERAGAAAAKRFLARLVEGYDSGRNDLGDERASRLSPYLHFGCISPRWLESRLPDSAGGESFRRQLCWRDFYAHVLRNFPANARHEHQARYRDAILWNQEEERFEAWCEGRTGYPLVDAGMRQLRAEGWMHNRARLVVGSFLTKDLGIDWRRGERFFMRLLIDGDEASNNGNWQWIASVGVDPQPVSRRLFNPTRQQARFDPDGVYVRRYVLELRGVPDRYLAEPWTMPDDVQQEAGCVIGRNYPDPIVDHAASRREALQRYAAARAPT